jgi:gliding motility-associated-like protein
MMNKSFCFLCLIIFLIPVACYATHNRAGEITYTHVSGNTYRAKIVTYTKIAPPAPDRPELEIFWGDGESDTIARTSITIVAPDIKRNEYFGDHTYSGSGTYIISFIDENRNAGVFNMDNSVTQPFYVETKLVINPLLNQLGIYNNSPILLEPPIDDGVVNQLFIHNPSAYDPDGDSLSYEITDCKGFFGAPVSGYFLPVEPTYPGSLISINAVNGDFIWNVPTIESIYNYAIIINEWKKVPGFGTINVGYVTRDFQVNIRAFNNQPPIVTAEDTCIEAGTTLAFNVSAIEPDNETVTISASGAPFQLSTNPAIVDTVAVSGTGSAIYNFIWPTTCAHVKKNPYQVVFKATDNNQQVNLTGFKTINIKVISPAPKNPVADAIGDTIVLHWNPVICSNAKGYNIYRKVNIANYTPDYCVTGVPASTGYVFIGKTIGVNDTVFADNNNGIGLATAVDYCYMITAYYPDGAEGYPSVEVCKHLFRDRPVITNTDVISTSATTGSIYIAWSTPFEIDTVQYPPPYSYTLQHAVASQGTFTDVATLNNWKTDTLWTDINLNTQDNQYIYRVLFNYNGGTFYGKSQDATSIYLYAAPGDNKVRLTWNLTVPWINSLYYIYRSDSSNPFALLDSTTQLQYTDYTALNTFNYCYYIESMGSYSQPGIIDPIFNKSQIDCAVPVDNEAPCIPVITAAELCDSSTVDFTWYYNVVNDCKTDDISYFTIYYAASEEEGFDSIISFTTSQNNYTLQAGAVLGGCYYITVTDTNGNVTDSSNSVCVERCPLYELPNIFTPDGNGINDLFTPVEQTLTGLFFRDISSIEMKIYNRWGGVVFETTDPLIKWDGTFDNNGTKVPDGVYFYTCTVFITGVKEDQALKLHGSVTVSRTKASD